MFNLLKPVLVISFAVLVSTVCQADEINNPISVLNHETGSTVRYSVVLLRGTIATDSTDLKIVNTDAAKHHGAVKPVVDGQRFKALVELVAGKNRIVISAAKQTEPLEFDIEYLPQTNPRYVRLVWMTDKNGDTAFAAPTKETPQDYEARLRTAALLMQTFTAEKMHELGYGHRTFRLERDQEGRVVVHTWKGTETRQTYYELGDSPGYWRAVRTWLNREHPDPMAKNIVLTAFTRKDPRTQKMKGHTALGGANLGLFGSASVFSWPRSISTAAATFLDESKYDTTKVHDDSVGRRTIWGLASTTIGATLHEMGHTFGLPHCGNRFGIMSRGFDYFNRGFTFQDPPSGRNRKAVFFERKQEAFFAPESASFLRWNPWLQLDDLELSNARPTIAVDAANKTIRVRCSAGVPLVGFHLNGNIQGFRQFDVDAPPKEVVLTFAEVRKILNGKFPDQIKALGSGGGVTLKRISAE